MRIALSYSNSSLILKKKVLQEFYHEFLLKLHNGRISLARLNKLVDKLGVDQDYDNRNMAI